MFEIFKKELFRVFGDKKLIFSMFILPAIMVVGIFSLMGNLVNGMVNRVEEHESIVYIQNAPEGMTELLSAVEFDKNSKITYLAAGDSVQELKDQILSGEVDLLVVFDADFMEKFASYQKEGDAIPNVTVSYNGTENYSNVAYSKFASLVLSTMEMQLLQTRFDSLENLNVFNTNEDMIQNEKKADGEFLAMMLPYLITFMLFSSAMGLCVDAIAGEKERGTMASMLISPINRTGIITGKIGALSVLSLISSAIYALSMVFAMPKMMGIMAAEDGGLPVKVSLSALQIFELLALMASLVIIYVALLCFISAFAKNTKEAQTYVMPIYMIVLIAGMMTMFNNGMKAPLTNYAIPVYGTALSIQGIMTSELSVVQFGMSVLGNLVCSVIFVVAVVKAFNSERIMLNA